MSFTDYRHSSPSPISFRDNTRISAVLVCRFILDLREVYYSTEHTRDLVSTIHFATGTMAGNLGAPLRTHSTWVTGPTDTDADDISGIEFSKEPFLVGLSPSLDDVELESTKSP